MPATEKAAQFDTGQADEKFLIVNESKANGLGSPVGYLRQQIARTSAMKSATCFPNF